MKRALLVHIFFGLALETLVLLAERVLGHSLQERSPSRLVNSIQRFLAKLGLELWLCFDACFLQPPLLPQLALVLPTQELFELAPLSLGFFRTQLTSLAC